MTTCTSCYIINLVFASNHNWFLYSLFPHITWITTVYSLFYAFDNEWWKNAITAIMRYLWQKRLSANAATKEINDAEGTETVKECVIENCFRRFKKGDSSFEDKPGSGRPSFVKGDAFPQMV